MGCFLMLSELQRTPCSLVQTTEKLWFILLQHLCFLSYIVLLHIKVPGCSCGHFYLWSWQRFSPFLTMLFIKLHMCLMQKNKQKKTPSFSCCVYWPVQTYISPELWQVWNLANFWKSGKTKKLHVTEDHFCRNI